MEAIHNSKEGKMARNVGDFARGTNGPVFLEKQLSLSRFRSSVCLNICDLINGQEKRMSEDHALMH